MSIDFSDKIEVNTFAAAGTSGFLGNPWDQYPVTTRVQCSRHVLHEVRFKEAKLIGNCSTCGDEFTVERMPGSFGLSYLKTLLVDAIGDSQDMANLLEEVEHIERILEVEELSIAEARKFLDIAHRMIEATVL